MFIFINIFHFCRLKSLGSNGIKGTNSGYVVIFCYHVLTHTLSIYRPDEDIEMKVCEPYSLHQFKPTDDIYDECEPPVDTSVYECM